MSEKTLPTREYELGSPTVVRPKVPLVKRILFLAVFAVLGMTIFGAGSKAGIEMARAIARLDSSNHDHHHSCHGDDKKTGSCVNVPKLAPTAYVQDPSVLDYFRTEEFRRQSLAKFSGAIRIPTESQESYGPPDKDPRWQVFGTLHKYLEQQFPLTHKHLKRELVNHYGLLFTWDGAQPDLKPVALLAHQDVVPVLPDTEHLWTHPPYLAHWDGTNVWGRGTGDDKHSLISILEAIEVSLEQGRRPNRTVLVSFGYDEESSGRKGAGALAELLEARYGPDSIEAIIDEGGFGVAHTQGVNLATIAVGEKGRFVGHITVNTPGGHGSMPPDHTGIGIAAKLIELIESTPHEPQLTLANPFAAQIHCIATHSTVLDKKLRKQMLKAGYSKKATKQVLQLLSKSPLLKYNAQTSQAINIINGGLKINALPEKVTIEIDHRVSVDTTVAGAEKKLVQNILDLAEKLDYGVVIGDEQVRAGADAEHFFTYERVGALEPAPVSPTTGSEPWEVFAGTVRHVYEDFGGDLVDIETGKVAKPDNIIVTPGLMTGNTDTRYYWNLSKNIFRFTPLRVVDDPKIHTVDEHVALDGHIEGVVVYYQYLQNI